MRTIGLLRHEAVRLLTRGRFGVVLVLLCGANIAWMLSTRSSLVSGPGVEGIVGYSAPMLFIDALGQFTTAFFIWPLVIGGTVAEDLHTGLSALLITRAGSRARWLAAKIGGAFVATLAAALVLAAVTAVGASLMAEWDTANISASVALAPELAEAAPLLYGFGLACALAVAGTGVALLAIVLGALGAAPVTSQVGACVVYIMAALALPPAANPHMRADFATGFAPWATSTSMALYWFGLCAALALLAYVSVRLREVR